MPVYAKKVQTTDPRFHSRTITIGSAEGITRIPVSDSEVICNGCNGNLAETKEKQGYLVYLGKRELQQDRPYDLYCEECLKRYFRGYKEVS